VDAELVAALEANPAQVALWARRAAELQASDGLERRLGRRMKPGSLHRLMEMEGLGNLHAALEGGKGAILYSLHLWGKYTFFGALAEAGYPPTVVATAPDPGRLRWLSALEERSGYRYIWMGRGNFGVAVEAANVLRRNGVVLLMLDWPQPHMVEVDFLGRRARLAAGVAEVARGTGAPLLDYYVYRRDRWVPQVAEIGPPHDAAGSVQDVLQQCADRLAKHVRRDPAQWTFFCNHRHSAFAPGPPAQELPPAARAEPVPR
jgi:lauroyl/myristoyl acyltransferase